MFALSFYMAYISPVTYHLTSFLQYQKLFVLINYILFDKYAANTPIKIWVTCIYVRNKLEIADKYLFQKRNTIISDEIWRKHLLSLQLVVIRSEDRSFFPRHVANVTRHNDTVEDGKSCIQLSLSEVCLGLYLYINFYHFNYLSFSKWTFVSAQN